MLKVTGVYIGHKREYQRCRFSSLYSCIPDNPELLEAKEKNLSLMDRAEFLGQIMKGHNTMLQ